MLEIIKIFKTADVNKIQFLQSRIVKYVNSKVTIFFGL